MYEELRRIQMEEKNSNNMAPVDNDIYVKVLGHIEVLKKGLVDKWDSQKLRELENSQKVLRDVEMRRVEKLLIYSFNEVYNGFDEMPGLANEERVLYGKVRKAIAEFREGIGKERAGAAAKGLETGGAGAPEIGVIKVRVLKDVPKFKALDGEEYGPFKSGEECELPRKEGEIMLGRGAAERLA